MWNNFCLKTIPNFQEIVKDLFLRFWRSAASFYEIQGSEARKILFYIELFADLGPREQKDSLLYIRDLNPWNLKRFFWFLANAYYIRATNSKFSISFNLWSTNISSWNEIDFITTKSWKSPVPNIFQCIEAVVHRCSVKKMFLEISQNSHENTCARVSFLIKLQAWSLQLYFKKDSGTGVFLWVWQNFQERIILKNTSGGSTPLV